MRVCVFDAWSPDDEALVNSHWVAARTALRLSHNAAAGVEVIEAEAVDQSRVAAEFARPHEGFAYFGHGQEHVLYRERDARRRPVPILDAEGVHLIGDRWFHAFACLSGHTLCHDAARANVGAYLGYRVTVNVTWELDAWPDELVPLLDDLVTVATLEVARGERSRGALRHRVRAASDRMVEWLDLHDDACAAIPWIDIAGLHQLASLLHMQMEFEGAAVVP